MTQSAGWEGPKPETLTLKPVDLKQDSFLLGSQHGKWSMATVTTLTHLADTTWMEARHGELVARLHIYEVQEQVKLIQ